MAAYCSFSWRSPISSRGNKAAPPGRRAFGIALLGLLTVTFACGRARADAGAPVDSSRATPSAADSAHATRSTADSLRATRSTPAPPVHRASPFSVMMRSAVLPGWGQMYNHKPWKAALVVGGEGYLIYKAWGKFQNEQDAADAGDQVAKDQYYNEKVNYIWWAMAVHLLQMADAYVDAHLSTFDVDFGPDDAKHAEWSAPGGGLDAPGGGLDAPAGLRRALPAARVALRVRF